MSRADQSGFPDARDTMYMHMNTPYIPGQLQRLNIYITYM